MSRILFSIIITPHLFFFKHTVMGSRNLLFKLIHKLKRTNVLRFSTALKVWYIK